MYETFSAVARAVSRVAADTGRIDQLAAE